MSPFLDSLKKPSQQERAPLSHARPDRRRRRRYAVVVLLILIVGVVGVLVTPAARRELRESFTRVPSSYTELYFTSAPVVDNAQVLIPVSVVGHGDGKQRYRLRVWLESSGGRTTASTTTTLPEGANGRTSTIVRLPLRQGAQDLHVALLDHPQTLHFRLGAHGSEHPQGSP
ncbi:hypothetical protein ACQEV2_17725 [Streptomyces sp. CA-251387]|uniref:hypothetical protein n=1 Tax=Streptomyces sp. CA-251387 TaxID=3240064 RepID=UPI003D8F9472